MNITPQQALARCIELGSSFKLSVNVVYASRELDPDAPDSLCFRMESPLFRPFAEIVVHILSTDSAQVVNTLERQVIKELCENVPVMNILKNRGYLEIF